jgi:hypothetical protein
MTDTEHDAAGTDDVRSDTTGLPVGSGPEGTAAPGDATPGDGTVGERPAHGEVDALRTARYGRESAAAAANLSDDTPTPQETHDP